MNANVQELTHDFWRQDGRRGRSWSDGTLVHFIALKIRMRGERIEHGLHDLGMTDIILITFSERFTAYMMNLENFIIEFHRFCLYIQFC